jgi:hypothetical protein
MHCFIDYCADRDEEVHPFSAVKIFVRHADALTVGYGLRSRTIKTKKPITFMIGFEPPVGIEPTTY